MHSILAVVGMDITLAYISKLNFLGTLANSNHKQRSIWQLQGIDKLLPVKIHDAKAVQPHLHSLQKHTLSRNTKVHKGAVARLNGRADNYERVWFCSLKRKIQFLKPSSHPYEREHLASLIGSHQPET